MTVRIKPLVWRIDASNDTYVSTQGGFTVKHGGPSGWEWRRGHIFGFADSRQGAFDAANERHVYEVSALLEPATPTAQLTSETARADELAAAIDSIETSEGLTCNGNLWRFWAKRSRELAEECYELQARADAAESERDALVEALDIIANPMNWYKSDDGETTWRGGREPDHIAETALAALKGPQT